MPLISSVHMAYGQRPKALAVDVYKRASSQLKRAATNKAGRPGQQLKPNRTDNQFAERHVSKVCRRPNDVVHEHAGEEVERTPAE